jgi:hypothetical protein
MSRYGTQYHVARPTGVCAATGAALVPGSACMATLCEREEDDGLERHDFAMDAWAGGARPPRLFSYWKTTVPAPEEKRRILVDDDVLADLFERLADDERPQRVAFRFVLALILLRKRRLKFVGRSGEGPSERWLMVRRPGGPEDPPMEVRNPHLSDDDVRELTAQLSEILAGDV